MFQFTFKKMLYLKVIFPLNSYLTLEHIDEFKAEVNKLNSEDFLFIQGKDPFKEIQQTFNKSEWIEAARGIVQQTESQKLLFIFRNGFRDIPKTKNETSENPEE